jgi:NDP-sugar pyrophosphorylase family protein
VPDAPQVVILAGGLGTRLGSGAGDLPKALVPIRGEPFAHHQLRLLAKQGVREVVYVIGFRGRQVRDAVGEGSAFGLEVSYCDEGGELHGTGGALRFALDAGALADPVAVLYGDSYLPIDLEPVWAAFETTDCPALMTVLRNEDRWDRSNAVVEDGLVVLYDKRSEARDPRMAWIDYGLTVLRRGTIEEIPAGEVIDLGDLYRALSVRGDLAAYEVAERFYEVGSPEGVAELERRIGA